MKIKIYQINPARDLNSVMFIAFDLLGEYQGSPEIDSGIYDMVHETEVPYNSIEILYHIFNFNRPGNFHGRSLSVSDVVEITESTELADGFYYCNPIGFLKVDFDPSKAHTA